MRHSLSTAVVLSALVLVTAATPSLAADLGDVKYSEPRSSEWSWRATSYGWLTWLDGSTTVRGREFEVNATPGDVIDALDFAFMGTIEGRRGLWSVWADIVYADLGASNEIVTTRRDASLGISASADLRMTTIEAAAAYLVGAWPGQGSVDVYAGARYWNQRSDVTLNASAVADLAGLEVSGTRAIARSGTVEWVDPFIGVRLRHDLPFGGEAFVRADVGGFGAGSDFSWQAIAAANWHVCDHYEIAWDAYVGYRALSVDYEEGAGRNRYQYDVTEHGPVLGLTGRF